MNAHAAPLSAYEKDMHSGPQRKDLPQNDSFSEDDILKAEQCVLACALTDNEVVRTCGLEPDDFMEPLHELIYRRMAELVESNQVATSVTLKPFIPKHLMKLDVTPAQYLTKLMIEGTSPRVKEELDGSLQVIKSAVMARDIVREANHLISVVGEGHTSLTLIDEIEKSEDRLKTARSRHFDSRKAAPSPGDCYLSSFQAASNRSGIAGVPICLPEIGRVLGENVMEAGNLYGLLSSSGEGKTSLTMQMIYHALKEGHPVLFLSYDQSAEQCTRQMIAQRYGIEVRRQREPMELLSEKEREQCIMFATELNRKPFEVIRCQRENVTQLMTYARRFRKKYRTGKTALVAIDHIGKIKSRVPNLSPDRISGDVTVEVKAFADEEGPDGTKSTVLMLLQRNTTGTRRDNPRPIDEDLYGGEGAKADYDAVMYLYRPAKYRDKRLATAADDRDHAKIQKVFGQFGVDIDTVAELGAVKCRFANPNVREKVDFDATFTRYVSQPHSHMPQERML